MTKKNALKVDDAALAGITRAPLPGSTKVYALGKQHPDLRVPFREIGLSPTKHANGRVEQNPPIVVYDTSGPFTDPAVAIDLRKGLAPAHCWCA